MYLCLSYSHESVLSLCWCHSMRILHLTSACLCLCQFMKISASAKTIFVNIYLVNEIPLQFTDSICISIVFLNCFKPKNTTYKYSNCRNKSKTKKLPTLHSLGTIFYFFFPNCTKYFLNRVDLVSLAAT